MLRIEEISLTSASPIGPAILRGLAVADLVVVVGPNGAGKSTIVSALNAVGHPPKHARLVCIDSPGGAGREVKAKEVVRTPEFTLISSADLMAKFRTLKDSLSQAAQVTRDTDISQLLEQVRRQLSADASDAAAEIEPLGIQQLGSELVRTDQSVTESSRGAPTPRTMREYQRLGQLLATAKGAPWTCPPLLPADERRAVQGRYRPIRRTFEGLADLRNAVNPLEGIPRQRTSRSHAYSAARSNCRDALSAATDSVKLDSFTSAEHDVAGRVTEVLVALRQAKTQVETTLITLDSLKACRTAALTLLKVSPQDGCLASKCPVCDTSIDAPTLIDSLTRTPSDSLPEHQTEYESWQTRLATIDTLIRDLATAAEDLTRGEKEAVIEHGDIRRLIEGVLRSATPAEQWCAEVSDAASDLCGLCSRWLEAHGSSVSSDGVDAAARLRDRANEIVEQLTTDESRCNQDLDRFSGMFEVFERLGDRLAVQSQLDQEEWTIDIERRDRRRKRAKQCSVWLKVLEDLAVEHDKRATHASQRVVEDSAVQRRFLDLLGRLAKSQPRLSNILLRQDEDDGSATVTSGDTDCSRDLSEGQRVLVNIASAVAVAGKVFEGTDGHPGWLAFDEPTNGLDPNSRAAVAEYLGSVSLCDLPRQIFVTTFETAFAEKLLEHAQRIGQRSVLMVTLETFVPGQPVRFRTKLFEALNRSGAAR